MLTEKSTREKLEDSVESYLISRIDYLESIIGNVISEAHKEAKRGREILDITKSIVNLNQREREYIEFKLADSHKLKLIKMIGLSRDTYSVSWGQQK